MGYYSNFHITADPEPFDLVQELHEVTGGYRFEYWQGAAHSDDIKWYDSYKDMLALSEQHPDVTFVVERNGEDGEGDKYALENGVVTNKWSRGWVKQV